MITSVNLTTSWVVIVTMANKNEPQSHTKSQLIRSMKIIPYRTRLVSSDPGGSDFGFDTPILIHPKYYWSSCDV